MASSRAMTRIVGGTEAKPNSVPWIVSLRTHSDRRQSCGGTLIRVNDKVEETDIVITASHCNNEEEFIPGEMEIVAGAHNHKEKAPEEQHVGFTKFVQHEKYNHESKENDIAIVKLEQPIKFGKTAQPACLPSPGERLADGTKGLVAGWGVLQEGSKVPSVVLQQLALPIVNHQKCVDFYKKHSKKTIFEQLMLCAGFPEGGKDSCQGDSGGPLTFKSTKGYVLQGVVSFGEPGCANPESAGIYVRVSNYVDWINGKIKELSDVAKRSS